MLSDPVASTFFHKRCHWFHKSCRWSHVFLCLPPSWKSWNPMAPCKGRTPLFSFLLSEKLRMASPEVVDTRSCVPRLRAEDGESQRLLGVAKNRAMAVLQTCSAARCKWARIKEFQRTTSFCPAGKLARGSKHGVDCCTENLNRWQTTC